MVIGDCNLDMMVGETEGRPENALFNVLHL